MSDPLFSEGKEKSIERWANCLKREFADRSKQSLNLKERSAKPHFEQFALERRKVKRVDIVHCTTHYWKQDTWPISCFLASQDVSWGTTFGTFRANTPPTLHLGCLRSFADTKFCMFFLFRILYKSVNNFAKLYFWKLWLVNGMVRYRRLTVTVQLIFWT
jgi:hypothetical protein